MTITAGIIFGKISGGIPPMEGCIWRDYFEDQWFPRGNTMSVLLSGCISKIAKQIFRLWENGDIRLNNFSLADF